MLTNVTVLNATYWARVIWLWGGFLMSYATSKTPLGLHSSLDIDQHKTLWSCHTKIIFKIVIQYILDFFF